MPDPARRRRVSFTARILLLGSGELGKEFAISAKRLGAYVIACDSYAGAPAMQVADEAEVFPMLDGPAYAAGLRDGMRLIRREAGKVSDSTVEMAYRVSDGSGEKVIRFLPEGKAEFDVQHLEVTAAGPEQEARCRRRLGGGE